MDSKPRLKDRLARLFRSPALVRLTATAGRSSRSLSAGESSRSFSAAAADIAHEPIFIPRRRASEADDLHFALLRRTLSLDHRPRRNLCGGCRPASASSPPAQCKEKKENRVSERRFFDETSEEGQGNGRACPPASPSLESPKSAHLYYYWVKEAESKRRKEMKKKKKLKMKKAQRSRSYRHELSISSSFDEEGFEFFSSEETDTFFSSRSFSSDSSEFYRRPSPKTKKSEQRNKQKLDGKSNLSASRRRLPAARRRKAFINGFQPLVSVSLSDKFVAEKSRGEGFPVLKKSSNPYNDFRSSMAEMIVERQIFGARELERLLHCYLSLNSPEIHSAIFRAFADISQVLFSY